MKSIPLLFALAACLPCPADEPHCPIDQLQRANLFKVRAQDTKNFEYDDHLWICFQAGPHWQIKHHPECHCHFEYLQFEGEK